MTRRLSPTQVIALFVVIAAFVALSVFALLARAYEPGRPAVAARTTKDVVDLLPPRVAAPIASATRVASPAAGPRVTVDADEPAGNAPVVRPPAGTPATEAPKPLAPCELGLAVPTEQAGLANLTPLVPLFGPFSPEAFAMVPAFAPGFSLVGPLIVTGGEFMTENPAFTDTAYSVLHPLEVAGYDTVAPLYDPVRPQVLAGEEQLAATIAPGVETFASLPGATCFPAVLALALG